MDSEEIDKLQQELFLREEEFRQVKRLLSEKYKALQKEDSLIPSKIRKKISFLSEEIRETSLLFQEKHALFSLAEKKLERLISSTQHNQKLNNCNGYCRTCSNKNNCQKKVEKNK
ncbi:MAG: hypothetical protein KAI67_00850 [Candidatus Pacebacteria bacterium]|nr:hypothetical protein [Candidatus Paceibacterota bacterium]